MFRLLLICAALFLLYFGFTITQSLDSKVFISLYNYNIETTFFFSLISLLLLLVLCFIVIKFLILIIDLPLKVHNIFSNRKINNDRYSLVLAFAKYITGNKTKAGSIARKLLYENLKETQEFYDLILAETEEDIDTKIAYFQKLVKSKEFAFYSNKNLAKLYYDKGLYHEAENCAIKAYNLNELDSDNLITLMHCYGQLALWTKFTFIANKIAKLYKQQTILKTSKIRHLFKPIYREEFVGNTERSTAAYIKVREDASTGLTHKLPLEIEFQKMSIADYYLLAAKQEINNNTPSAIDYLESALDSNFVSPELLELYLNINNKLDDKKKIKLLKNTFNIIQPDLEIVKLFKKFTSLSDEQIYEELTKDLDTKKDAISILAIQAYLGITARAFI